MTGSSRRFWSRLALGFTGLAFALGVIFLMDAFSEYRRVKTIHESLEADLDSLTCQLEDAIDSLEFWIELKGDPPEFLTLQFNGVSWPSSSEKSVVDWRTTIPQETRLLLLYDTLLLAGISSPEAARKVYRVYFDEEEVSAL